MSNNTVKASIAYRFGEVEYGKKVLTGFALSIVLGIVTIIGMYLF
jgi:di/tricarboxylate transporter